MNQKSRPFAVHAPDSRGGSGADVVIWECGYCKSTIVRRKGDRRPEVWETGVCNQNPTAITTRQPGISSQNGHWWRPK